MATSKAPLHTLSGDTAAADLAAARRVLATASEALAQLAEALNGDFSHAVGLMLVAKGRIIVSGMGKSGHVARKIAATLSSTGTPAYFVHPAEASHGDMGAITRQDVLLLLSWGGETAELSDLITYAKRYRIPIIAIGANPDSTLIKASDVKLLLPRAPEACPMGLAPTTSTTMMLSLGDALAVALMERKGFSPDQYRDLHPGGSLGRALVRVSDLMHSGEAVPLARPDTPMRDLLLTMASGRLGCVGIVDAAGALTGIVTDGDIRRHAAGIENRLASEVMTANPKVARPGQLAAEALALMTEKKITQLFVLAQGDPAPKGVIHIHDCLRAGIA
ncbi:MAG TPA: KpsF/GutQ family sugar-phosphate isomerase [Rhizomicrobium sp.]|jgi:arabinose-5-phosphate isomerase|nr:KpsF/GutQ family sugar-phosphate isomerase [Rhizomicrobium sp.]